MRDWQPALARMLCIACVLAAWACGPSTPSANVTPSAASGKPAGGPVPAQLLGDWLLPPAAANIYLESSGEMCPPPLAVATCMFKLTFTATTFYFEINAPGHSSGGGDAVVNGTEIDFFNAPGCGLQFPDGVGRYMWTLTDGVLHFTSMNQDPCPRSPILANQSYSHPG
jgi:hypothetical protein